MLQTLAISLVTGQTIRVDGFLVDSTNKFTGEREQRNGKYRWVKGKVIGITLVEQEHAEVIVETDYSFFTFVVHFDNSIRID